MAKEFLQKESSGPNDWTVWSVSGRIDMVTADSAYATGEDIVLRAEMPKDFLPYISDMKCTSV